MDEFPSKTINLLLHSLINKAEIEKQGEGAKEGRKERKRKKKKERTEDRCIS